MKRAIITGATGAIGTALINALIGDGVETLVFCRRDSKRLGVIPKHPLVSVKYCALDELATVANDTGKQYDVFYHFAWDGTIGAARNDMRVQNKNVKYALDAVDAAKRFGCGVFIGAGSQAEYGRVEGKLKSDTPAFPENGYGMAKLCAGQMTRLHAHSLGMRHNWVRVLSVYGPNDGEKTMIMSTLGKLKNGCTAQLTKGEQLWDYLYSADAARAFKAVGEKGKDGKVYVLGSGTAIPLKDYIRIMSEMLNANDSVALGAVPYSENQVMYLCADISEIVKDTGWTPEISFKDGIARVIGSILD